LQQQTQYEEDLKKDINTPKRTHALAMEDSDLRAADRIY